MKLFLLYISLMSIPFFSYSQSFNTILKDAYRAEEPGAILVTRKGKEVNFNTIGLANLKDKNSIQKNTHFRMASVSKQFTAMSIYQLIRQNKLSFATKISSILKDLPFINADITVGQLLNHSSGIWDYEDIIPINQKEQLTDHDVLHMVSMLNKSYFNAGEKFRYSNTAYCLLALICEKIAGLDYPTVVKSLIFDKLKIKEASVYPTEENKIRAYGYHPLKEGFKFADQSVTSATKGDGGVYISAQEYSLWLTRLNPLFDEKFYTDLVEQAILVKNDVYYSLGFFFTKNQNQEIILFHSGETTGFHNIILFDVANDQSLILFSNRDDMKIADIFQKAMEKQKLMIPQITIPLFSWLNTIYAN